MKAEIIVGLMAMTVLIICGLLMLSLRKKSVGQNEKDDASGYLGKADSVPSARLSNKQFDGEPNDHLAVRRRLRQRLREKIRS